MSNGQMATIISYQSAKNIYVKFEDGTIVKIRNTNYFGRDLFKTLIRRTVENRLAPTARFELAVYQKYTTA